jgi:hypothetical protein
MPQHKPSKRKRTRKPGEEVESNLNERIDRALRQQEEREVRLNGRQKESCGITDPRYQMKPLR